MILKTKIVIFVTSLKFMIDIDSYPIFILAWFFPLIFSKFLIHVGHCWFKRTQSEESSIKWIHCVMCGEQLVRQSSAHGSLDHRETMTDREHFLAIKQESPASSDAFRVPENSRLGGGIPSFRRKRRARGRMRCAKGCSRSLGFS